MFMFVAFAFAITIILLSCAVSKGKNKFFDVAYAVLSMLEFINRLCLLGNLWVSSSVFTLAICFMDLIGTSAIGVFFNFLFMSPIY